MRHRVILLRLNHLHRVTLPHQVAVEVTEEEVVGAAVEVAAEEVGVEVAGAEAVGAAEEEAREDDRQLKKLTEAPP